MDHQKVAEEVVRLVGGAENVKGVTHCVTRLRFTLADEGKADTEALKATDGVMGVVQQGGQYQVVIGPEVEGVFKAVEPLVGSTGAAQDSEAAPAKPEGIKGYANAALDTLISCFTPLIPAIAGAGMIKVLLYILSTFGLVGAESVEYQVLNVIGDGVYYFLPLMVAVTAANKMGTNPFLAMGLAGIMMHPTLLTLGEAGSQVSFFGAPRSRWSITAPRPCPSSCPSGS